MATEKAARRTEEGQIGEDRPTLAQVWFVEKVLDANIGCYIRH